MDGVHDVQDVQRQLPARALRAAATRSTCQVRHPEAASDLRVAVTQRHLLPAACEDGLPNHGRYAELLAEAGSPDAILELLQRPGFSAQDQWQVQIQAQIQRHADVYVYSDGLDDAEIRGALLTPTHDIEATLAQLQPRRLCVLPERPLTIAYLNHSGNGAAR